MDEGLGEGAPPAGAVEEPQEKFEKEKIRGEYPEGLTRGY